MLRLEFCIFLILPDGFFFFSLSSSIDGGIVLQHGYLCIMYNGDCLYEMLVIRESVHTLEFYSNFGFKLFVAAGYSSVNSYVSRGKRCHFGGTRLGNVATCNANMWSNGCFWYKLRCCCNAVTK